MSHRRDVDSIGRMLKLAQILFNGGELTAAYIERNYAVSPATAKRDMVRIEASLPVEVTHVALDVLHSPNARAKVMRLKVAS